MVNPYEISKQWNKILTIREIKDTTPTGDDASLTDTEFAVLCHIAHQKGSANITSILNHPYFAVMSLSTVKRSVLRLIGAGLIRSESASFDKRERMLTVVEYNDG